MKKRKKYRIKFNEESSDVYQILDGLSGYVVSYGDPWEKCLGDDIPDDLNPSTDQGAITLYLVDDGKRGCRYVYHNGNWYSICP